MKVKGITKKQFELIQTIQDVEVNAGHLVDFDELLGKLSWSPSKESAQFTIRAAIKNDYIKKMPLEVRRKRLRVCYQVTKSGLAILDPRSPISVPEGFEDLDVSFVDPDL